MRRISSPVAGMKAPCVFSGVEAESEVAAKARGNYSLFNRRADLAKALSGGWTGVSAGSPPAMLAEPVETAEAGVAFLAHIALEDRGVGLAQVDDHQAIDHIGKFAVKIEAHQPASNLRILLEQDGQSFAIFLHIGDGLGKFVKIAHGSAESAAIPAAKLGSAEGRAGVDEVGKLVVVVPLLKIAHNHLAGQTVVFVADANRSEQHR